MSVVHLSDHKRTVNHELCQQCPKNGVTCRENDDTCLPLEMFVQLCKEPQTIKKLEYIDNARGLIVGIALSVPVWVILIWIAIKLL